MRKAFLILVTLSLAISVIYAQPGRSELSKEVKISLDENSHIGYPREALMEGKEGLVICRIFLDKDKNHKSHQLLYASHAVLADAVNLQLPEMNFQASQTNPGEIRFLAPFVFELQKEPGNRRSLDELLEDAEACKRYGLNRLSMHYYDEMLRRQKKRGEDNFSLYKGRMEALLGLNRWKEARQEVTNMLAMSREKGSLYAHLQPQLRVQRSLLSLLTDQGQMAIGDIHWLDRHAEQNIFFVSEYLEQLHLMKGQATNLIQTADELKGYLPGGPSFWLEATIAIALGETHRQEDAFLRLSALLEKEVKPELQAALMCQMGWSLYNQAKPVEALSHLQEATRLSPQMAQAHFYKAISLARLDYGAEAYESMHNALSLGLPIEKQVHGQQMLSVFAINK